jgi:hypothetical protein
MFTSSTSRTGLDDRPVRVIARPPMIISALSAPQISPHAWTDTIDRP